MTELSRRTVLRAAGGLSAGAVAAGAGAFTGAAPALAEGGTATTQGGLSVSSEPFGTMPDGTAVRRFTFGSPHGVQVQAITYGAAIQTLHAPDRAGRRENVVLGLATLDEYRTKSPYFGAIVGRYANRIKLGRFTLDGKTYQIPVNDGKNALHGGTVGFDKHVWGAEEIHGQDAVGVRFTLVSPDGDMGFPGTLSTTVSYTVDAHGRLTIDYHATTDKPTIVNLSNHTYWNLGGEGGNTVYDHLMQINADRYTTIDSESIPLGPLPTVSGTPFDFRRATPIGERIRTATQQILNAHGYDHNWVLNRGGSGLSTACQVHHPSSGRTLRIDTDQPGLQFYSGNFLDGTLTGISGHTYRQGDTFVLETQHFPDSPNESSYPSTVLRPGQEYRTRTVLTLSAG